MSSIHRFEQAFGNVGSPYGVGHALEVGPRLGSRNFEIGDALHQVVRLSQCLLKPELSSDWWFGFTKGAAGLNIIMLSVIWERARGKKA